jgi:GTPase Era involved in 16S rRNA processing
VVGPESWHGDAHGARVTSAWRTAASADVIMFLVDAHRQARAGISRCVFCACARF